ncbi:MAG: ABC transporter permease [Actinobacteria bacterium]|nr:ABC transporter permease [Actinomycetota bacterium]
MTASVLTEDVPRARGIVRVLRATHGRMYPRIVGSIREPTWLFYETLLPLLGTIAFVYVYKAIGAAPRFLGYVVMGGAAAAVWGNVMWNMASQLWWEKKDGNLEIYLTAPCGLPPILLGMSIGGIFSSLIRGTAVVVIGSVIFHVPYALTHLWLFILVFVVALVALYGLGVMLSSLFLLWGRESWHTANLFMEPVFLVTGFYFPVSVLGFWTGVAASIIPLTFALDALRQLLYPDVHPALLSVRVELACLVALATIFFFASRYALRKMEWLARRAGKLSERL